MNEQMDNLKT